MRRLLRIEASDRAPGPAGAGPGGWTAASCVVSKLFRAPEGLNGVAGRCRTPNELTEVVWPPFVAVTGGLRSADGTGGRRLNRIMCVALFLPFFLRRFAHLEVMGGGEAAAGCSTHRSAPARLPPSSGAQPPFPPFRPPAPSLVPPPARASSTSGASLLNQTSSIHREGVKAKCMYCGAAPLPVAATGEHAAEPAHFGC